MKPTNTIAGGLVEYPAVRPDFVNDYEGRPPANCWVYEVWDTQGRLAYVGIADNFEKRWRSHQHSSWWLSEIEIWYVSVHGFRSRREARKIEAAVINTQSPVYNTRRETSSYRCYLATSHDGDECRPVKKRVFALPGASAY